MILTETTNGTFIHMYGQRDRELMQQALQRALNTWDDAPADLIRIYDLLRAESMADAIIARAR